ncbi:MAG: aminotransferase class III-fold pyridoxal phosphate-dependent enzyme, partial [Nitrospinaceae bacterium]|nr:aminotransferase class III-fold pyridoxal phosphate-dependent enzyme [Nitrospinaceae bacterium]
GFKYVPFNNIAAVKKAITKKTCAVMVEPIQGEGGVNLADKAYLKTLRKLCNENKILLIFDEVQTGFGRTGPLFAYERYKVKPDIITLAKALGAGVAIGALGATNRVIKSFVPGTHAATFGGNPLACAAALASLKVLTKKKFLEKSENMGVYFRSQLEQLAESFPIIREVRGAGMMLALELDRPGIDVVTDCMQQGFLINCIQQNVLRFLPPLTVTQKEIERLIKALSKSLTKLKK